MVAWGTIINGAVLSGALGAVYVALLPRYLRPGLLLTVASGTAAGALAWNAILRVLRADQFLVEAPHPDFPISWQDVGSGLFALVVLSVVLGLGPLRTAPARESLLCALLGASAALVVDVYQY